MKLQARPLNPGWVVAEVFLVEQAFSFIGDFDPQTGALLIPHHPRYGESLAGKALVCPGGKGGTMAPFLIYEAFQQGNAPAAIICNHADPILFESAMAIDIPIFDRFDEDVLALFKHGQRVAIDGEDIAIEAG
ncbi:MULTISPECIES: aconitase X swivel domain-containing protein [Serratia]|jgi:predicted aconitase with swiveling domain|uniref:aconitase X swivel domain-containing protein n=1 Tax=Serratia TaxID=613 RepID=UPI0007C6482D|nr:DUF126 domain-containing protein [Serratia surfactantfaciens]BEM88558.1 hypothetical protein SME46J_30280 [Serratia marcescens]AOF00515.1 hypothetical protein ATE40_015085 [Serratia surfactantfaciens]MBI6154394.1 DUF126 domain-containing protein [Serratia surfactantfaciens]BEO38890.1 hypothetical protein SMQE08_29780 [Serratia marcescens]BEO62661.1 hypothetical protein SMQE30_30840 [Serratia marcescens]